MPRHVSMHGMPQTCSTRHARYTQVSRNCNGLSATRYHFSQHRLHKQKQHGLSCFTVSGARRLRHRPLIRCIAAANPNSMAQEQLGDGNLPEYVDLANELAELAGSITKRFFRYSIGPCKLFSHVHSAIGFGSPSGQVSWQNRYLC